MTRFLRPSGRPDWLSLGEASRILGVAPGTLRRWSDAGRITSFTTPGGHRRYRRVALERLLPSERTARPLLARSGLTTSRLIRAYRQEARNAVRQLPWLNGLSDQQREWFRSHGRRLAQALVMHLDAVDEKGEQTSIAQATSEAAAYGRMAAGLGVSLSHAIESFLQFRRPFLRQLGLFADRRGLDAFATTELMEATEKSLDRLLLAVMNAYSVERVGERYGYETEGEGLR